MELDEDEYDPNKLRQDTEDKENEKNKIKSLASKMLNKLYI